MNILYILYIVVDVTCTIAFSIAFPFDEAGTALLARPIVSATLRFQISIYRIVSWAVGASEFASDTLFRKPTTCGRG